MKLFKTIFISIFTLLISFQSQAQRAKDGNYTATALNDVVNTYTNVTAASGSTLTVGSNAMSGAHFSGNLQAGDLIMIYQAYGADVDINTNPVVWWGSGYTVPNSYFPPIDAWGANPEYFGSVTNYNQAGKFEQAQVLSVSGANTITLQCPLKNSYAIAKKVQVIRMPRFNNLTVNGAASIVPAVWNGATGGIVAIEVNTNLNMLTGSVITASEFGFRGGAVDLVGTSGSNVAPQSRFLGSPNAIEGSEHGESIFGHYAELDAVYSRYGIGAVANGGGGAGFENAGGAGGSNIFIGAGTYTGRGTPIGYVAAWNQEYAGFGGSTSPGGGGGGYAQAKNNRDATTTGPDNTLWGGDARKNNGGRGGHPLTYDATRLFFGGGGGAGDDNSNQGGSGGRGGGIVYISNFGTTTGTGTISSNGQNGQDANPNNFVIAGAIDRIGVDGAGGGGAGGSIVLENAGAIPATITLATKGGNGGSQYLTYANGSLPREADGPGGSGTGGSIAFASGTPTQQLTAGANGTSNSISSGNLVAEFPPNGATTGNNGFGSLTAPYYDLQISDITTCTVPVTLTVTVLGTLPVGGTIGWYTQQYGGSTFATGTSTNVSPAVTTTYYVGVCPGTFRVPVTVTITATAPTPTISAGSATTFCTGGSVTLTSSATTGNQWYLGGTLISGATAQTYSASVAGNYTVIVTTGSCVSAASLATTVTINPTPSTPTISAGSATTFCTGGSVTLTSSSAAGNQWSLDGTPIGGATAQTYSASVAGSYTVITTSSGCPSLASAGTTVTVNPIPATPTISAGSTTTFCAGGSVTLTSSSATGNQWSLNGTPIGGATAQTYSATASGSYTVIVTTSGCPSLASAGITVTVTPTPATPTISAGSATTFCSGGSVTLTSSSATGNQWSLGGVAIGGATAQTYSATASGSYTVIVTTSGCPSLASTATVVTVNPNPVITVGTVTSPSACATATGSIQVSGTATGTVSWTGTATGNSAGSVTLPYTITGLAAGTYNISISVGGCTSNTLVQGLTDPSAPATPTISAGSATTFCTGGSVTLTSSSVIGNQWSLGGVPIGGATAQTYVANASGNYTVVVTSGGCTSSASAATTVTVNSIPATPTISAGSATTFCTGGSVTLTSSSATGNQWSLNGTPIGGATAQTYVANATGNYTVIVTTGGCSSLASAATAVTVNPIPATPTISAGSATTFCTGGSVTLTSSSTTGNQWSLNGIPIGGATGQTYSATASGNYTVIVTTAGCPSLASASTAVTVNPIPATPTISAGSATTFCAPGTVTLTSSSATGNQWSLNGTPIGGATAQTYVANATGNYTVVVTTGGCSSLAAAATAVTVNAIPATPTISAGSATTFCAGGSVTLTSSSATGNQWSLNGVPIGGATGQTYSATATGNYTVITTSGGCPSLASTATTVTVNPNPVITVGTVTNPSACATATGSIQVNGAATGIVSWTGTASGNSGSVTLPYSITGLSAGTYNISITAGSCTSNTLIQGLTDPSAPATPTISAGSATTFCAPGSVTLTSSSTTGNQWSLNGTPIGGATAQTYPATATGNYTVAVTTGGCTSAASIATTVTVNLVPAVAVSNSGPICIGGSFDLDETGGDAASWVWSTSGGATITANTDQSPTVTGAVNGEVFTVIVTSANTCTNTANTTVSVVQSPVLSPIANVVNCGPYTLPVITGTNLTGSQAYYDNSVMSGGLQITGPITSTQTVWVYDGIATCEDEISFQVTINPLPTVVSFTGGGNYCDAAIPSDVVVTVTGNPNWTINYTLNGTAQNSVSSTSPISLGNAEGVYVLTSISDANCTSPTTQTQTIIVTPTPAQPIASADETYCTGDLIVGMSVSGAGGIYTWYTDNSLSTVYGTGSIITPLGVSQVYYVTESLNGCESTPDNIVVTVENCEVIYPTAFTPDGDGTNDTWEVLGLDEKYPDNTVRIYNRWGNLIFEHESSITNPYNNSQWDGTYKGAPLPVGSFYYIIDVKGSDDKVKGTVSIILN